MGHFWDIHYEKMIFSEHISIDAAESAFEAAGCDKFFDDYYYQKDLRKCEEDSNYYNNCQEILCEDRGAKAQLAFEWVR